MYEKVKTYVKSFFDFFSAKENKKIVKWIDRLITVVLLTVLVYQIYDLPFEKIVKALPINPLFYLSWLVLYFMIPVSEYFIYQTKWDFSGFNSLKGFVLKRIYNNELYNYVGELYFISWTAKHFHVSKSESALFIKDNNIISSIVSSVFSFAVIGFLWFFGFIEAGQLFEGSSVIINTLIAVIFVAVGFLLYRFRKNIIHSNKEIVSKMLFGYSIRFIIRNIILVFMWYSAAPDVALVTWLNFLFIKTLLDRLPVGNRGIIFLSMAPFLSESFSIGIETFTAIQLAATILDKVVNAASLVWAKSNTPLENSN